MTLIQNILDLAGKGPASLEEHERLSLLQAAEKLTLALENPLEKFLRLFLVWLSVTFISPVSNGALHLLRIKNS